MIIKNRHGLFKLPCRPRPLMPTLIQWPKWPYLLSIIGCPLLSGATMSWWRGGEQYLGIVGHPLLACATVAAEGRMTVAQHHCAVTVVAGPTMVLWDSRPSLACLQISTMTATQTDNRGSGSDAINGGGNGTFYLPRHPSTKNRLLSPWGLWVEPPWTLMLVTLPPTWLGGQNKGPSDRHHPGHHGQQINHCGMLPRGDETYDIFCM